MTPALREPLSLQKHVAPMPFDPSHMTSLFENATEGFIITDSKATIVLVNPAACTMFGYSAGELIGNKIEMLLPIHYRAGHEKLREGFYENPQNRVMGHGRDLQGQHRNGGTFPVEVSLSTYMQNGERYAIAFVVNITHRKEIEHSIFVQQQQLEKVTGDMRLLNAELEAKVEERTTILKTALQRLEQSQEELREALDKERQLNEIKSRFVSMASHEFRTPLSTVLSSASLVAKYTTADDQEKRQRHVEKIKASVKHLNDLLEDFLSLGKLEDGKVGARLAPFHLPGLIADTVDEMKALVKSGQQIFYRHSGDETIESDPKLVRNILINLIANAIKFSGEGSGIDISSVVHHTEATISVRDEGIGILPEDQAHLFGSFYRGKNAVNIQGTGLGLHIVKRYLDLVGGTIKVVSRLGEGTTVAFSIPVK